MLTKFLNRRGNRFPQASIPPGQRVYAIGDIHGCDDLLGELIDAIDADDAARKPAETTIIVLGDLVDRGPDSAKVVERLRTLKQQRPALRLILGNHEEIFLGALSGDSKALRMFTRIGGRETLLSYGVGVEQYDRCDYEELQHALDVKIPQAHRDFLASFEDMITIGDYMFVHAGIRPSVPLDDQIARDLRWIREPFLGFPRSLGKIVVHGHTISDEVEQRLHRIGIDTGAYLTGRLTAVGMHDAERWYLST